jgi:hypothetical protein
MAIEAGTVLEATTASGDTVLLRSIGEPTRGRDFPVVWVCTEEEYQRAQAEGDDPDAIPWPLTAVSIPDGV